jgi:glycosyltransferase involved in cell wall biosynthesis
VLKKTIELLRSNLKYKGEIVYYIGVDGNLSTCKMFSGHSDIICMPGPNNGLGANLNRLIKNADSDFLLQLDDDHHLLESLNLDRHIRELEWNERVGWIRLMGVGYHDYYAKLVGEYWHIFWQSPELYIPSNRPHLKHRRFHDYYGLYPEGLSLGGTEENFCRQCKNFDNLKYKVAIPLNDARWDHVGKSWQLRDK